jgi:hypothetical protein
MRPQVRESRWIRYYGFTPLEIMPRCSVAGMKTIPFSANTGFKAPCEPSRQKVEDFLTGFT